MKHLLILVLSLISVSAFGLDLVIPANGQVKAEKLLVSHCNAEIKNSSAQELEIAVRDMSCGEIVSSFGLGFKAKETVYIGPNQELFIKNLGDKEAKVKISFTEASAPKLISKSIEFILENTTDISDEDILLQQRQLDTQFSYFTSVGINYRFGSNKNNFVNARF